MHKEILRENFTIYHGDCNKVLYLIDQLSADAVVTDPPYGTNDGRGKVIKRGDTNVDFGVIGWDMLLPLKYLMPLKRIMKWDTWGFIFTDNKAVTTVWEELEKNNLSPRNTYHWIKYNKAPTPRSNFKSCVETAVVFTKGRTNKKWNGGGNEPNYVVMPFVSEGEHPTQKPVSLIEKIILLVTEKGDIVIDPFMGSGTTGIACAKLDRGFIGIEISDEYFSLAKEGIQEALSQPSMF